MAQIPGSRTVPTNLAEEQPELAGLVLANGCRLGAARSVATHAATH